MTSVDPKAFKTQTFRLEGITPHLCASSSVRAEICAPVSIKKVTGAHLGTTIAVINKSPLSVLVSCRM